jgi:hypothetical protein
VAQIPLAESLAPDFLDGKGEAYNACKKGGKATHRYGELTGQVQSWGLFAPNVWDSLPFPAVELRWDDDRLPLVAAARYLAPLAGADPWQTALLARSAWLDVGPIARPPYLVLSENEPKDINHFLRMGRFRLRRLEGGVLGGVASSTLYPLDPRSDSWREGLEKIVRNDPAFLLAYLRWRVVGLLKDNPDWPVPRQVILHIRVYHIPAPPGPEPWGWEDLGQHPVARWLPEIHREPGCLPLDVYNPVADRFESLEK